MGNYDRMVETARRMFMERDQEAMIRRLSLKSDPQYIYIDYIGRPFRIDRADGTVLGQEEVRHTEAMTIYDYVCRTEPLPAFRGQWRGTMAVRGLPPSTPNATELQAKQALVLNEHIGEVRSILEMRGCKRFPQGDAAYEFDVFERMQAVFQFWEGDEEFPPQIRFLWDEYALSYLMFETMHYVMGDFLHLLDVGLGL